jgi:hypothetical protein
MGIFEKLGELLGRAVADMARFFLKYCLFPFMDKIGEELNPLTADLIAEMEANPELPSYLKPLLAMAKEGGGQAATILMGMLAGPLVSGGISSTAFSWLERAKQHEASWHPYQPVPIINLMILMYRKLIEPEFFFHEMSRFGIDEATALLMFYSYAYYPDPQQMIEWIAKEVFEPDMIAKFGLDQEIPTGQAELFAKAGVDGQQLRNFWIAHWLHPGFGEVARLFHRDQLDYDTFWEWFKIVEIPPIYRDGMIEITWDTPNRIETRMMCRYLDMPKSDVVKLLQYAGLKEEYRSDAADFMIIMGVESDLRKRYSYGWITAEEIKSELRARGVNPGLAERVYQRIVKEEKPDTVEKPGAPSRTDLAAMVRYLDIPKTRVMELLAQTGLVEEYRSAVADNIIIMAIETDLRTRYRNGWILADDIKAELTARGIATEIVERVYQRIVKEEKPETVETPGAPSRSDITAMCKYLDLNKAEVMELLGHTGLVEEYRSPVADNIIIMAIETDLRTRYRNGWISAEEVKSKITSRGVSPETAERVYERIVKEEKFERLAEERDLTKAEIVKGVKKGVITWEEGVILLMDLNYDQSEAQFILEINISAATGSPENKAEFKKLTELAQIASAQPSFRPWEEIVKAEVKEISERGKTRIRTEDEVKIETDTVRRRRRKNLITRDQEIKALLDLGWDTHYATAAADNDDIRLAEKAGEE